MSKQTEALKLALEAFEADASNENFLVLKHCVREALAEQPAQQQEPVAYASSVDWRKNQLMSKAQYDNCLPKNRVDFDVPLYTSPPASKPWVGLTDWEREKLRSEADEEDAGYTQLIKATEAKLREKNA